MKRIFPLGFLPVCFALLSFTAVSGEDGYRLWLRYEAISDTGISRSYHSALQQILVTGNSGTIDAVREELERGLEGMLGKKALFVSQLISNGTLMIGTPESSALIASLPLKDQLQKTGQEGYVIKNCNVFNKACIVIAANNDIGLLYGTFHFLRLLQTYHDIGTTDLISIPSTQIRLLNHWDNLDRTVERGYAGFSLWNWHLLPGYLSPRYKDYARVNASIGINGAVLTNVNANALVLTPQYLEKAAALAGIFRPYGIRIYLTARFNAPVEIGELPSADPLDPRVNEWWEKKITEIYSYIPDFGGFLVKANSEGQPGPQNYGRTHAEGANMLARTLAPHGGIVMWRAFVYDNNIPEDRAKQAYNEFTPLDGKFDRNVFVQVKNGPIDFQPREPFHPLFGAMPNTPMMMEFQITQEYLGQGTHLVYLAPLFKECLESDTYARGKGSEISKVIDGTLENHGYSGMAGVSNIGDERNWCGHPFAQANWYAFGRLAWDLSLTTGTIAEEWIRMTFTNDDGFIIPVKQMMLNSREYAVNYMTPLGLHHIMAMHHHHGPGPWVDEGRPDWTSVYYHRADSTGIGFDRTSRGSNAISQYFPEVRQMFDNPGTCPESLLLWFHHMNWDHTLSSGQTVWEELCHAYYRGVDSVKKMQQTWNSLAGKIDAERFNHVKALLEIQRKESIWWRNACVLYFQTFSRLPIPEELEKPDQTVEYYRNIKKYYVPGI
ncbi:MAG: alpha-glucuronidase [Bacteroidales bacterium]|nr:alpha-glucuronidase [Bacteroidales bacterium]